jgi:hypothetical protein
VKLQRKAVAIGLIGVGIWAIAWFRTQLTTVVLDSHLKDEKTKTP